MTASLELPSYQRVVASSNLALSTLLFSSTFMMVSLTPHSLVKHLLLWVSSGAIVSVNRLVDDSRTPECMHTENSRQFTTFTSADRRDAFTVFWEKETQTTQN